MRGWVGPLPIGDRRPRIAPGTRHISLRPFCTMLDWLSVMMTGPWHCIHNGVDEWVRWDVPGARPGLCWYLSGIETKDFRRVYYVTDQVGEKLATICCAPRDAKKFPPDFLTVQFANSTLPTGEWRDLLRNMLEMGCTYLGVQRVDIAADGWEDEGLGGGGDFIPVVQAALAGHGEYFGKAHWQTDHLGRGAKSFNGFRFGSRAGNKFMRCYRKKREMKAKGLKPHIVAAWREALNGADPMADPREVGRLEVQLRGKELRRYFPGERTAEGLAALHDPGARVAAFAGTTRTMFDFRTFPTDGRARSARPMHKWDWSLCTTNAPADLRREQRARKMSPHRVKVGIHALYDLYWATGEMELLAACERQAHAAGPEMVDWFHRCEKAWQQEQLAMRNSGDEFTRQYLANLVHCIRQGRTDSLTNFSQGAMPYAKDENEEEEEEEADPDGIL